MESNSIQTANFSNLPMISEIYSKARAFMRLNGNPTQWKDELPCQDTLYRDIEAGNLFVMKTNQKIHAVFAFIIGNDPTYSVIVSGAWLSYAPYGTLHRIASDGEVHGVFERIVDFALKRIQHLRVDTHSDNKIMQHLAEKNGFRRCGVIYVEDGSPRIAYERL